MSNILSSLNPQQQAAVTHIGSPLLILAGAGSGKTRVLTHRAAFFIQQKLAKPSEVLLLTFTNKAAGEMKARMQKLLASSAQDDVLAGTFHSFCCRILRHDGPAIGVANNFVIYDSDDQENMLRTIIEELGLTTKEFKPSSVMYFIENAKNTFQSPSDLKNQSQGFWEKNAVDIYRRYQQRLDQYQALDFNDLLFKTIELFLQHPHILEKYQNNYPYILVDEYQDTNQIQYQLTKLLAKKSQQITAVGDASQAIYGWRGADYRNLTAFTADFKDVKVVNLEENYRSTQIILNAANAIISKNNSHPVLKLFTKKQSVDTIKVYEAESEVAEADYVSDQINYLHQQLHFAYKDIAVLYRMNSQSRVIEESFLKNSIPYVLIGGLRFYDRAEIKDILAMLRFANNKLDKLSEGRILKALGKNRKIRYDNYLSTLDVAKLTSAQLLETLILNSGYLEKFDLKDEDDLRKVDNIKELKSVAATYPQINDFLENIALVQQEYSLQEKNNSKENREGVRLMTLHSSKGLEFDAVFLVGFEEGILPHSRSLMDDKELEEERRLCYVGVTRAKDLLYITYATNRLFYGKSSLGEPSRFLHDIPQNLIEFQESTNTTHDYRHQSKSSDSDLRYDPDIY